MIYIKMKTYLYQEEEILPWHGCDVDDPICIGNWTELASVNGY